MPLALALAVCVATAGRATGAADEFRGMWVSRFEWPSSNMNTCKSNIDTVMSKLAQHRFNAVLFQVRGQADTLYPSPYEPWSPIVSADGNTPPGWGSFDPLQYALTAARAHGLEFHAYINTHPCWQSASYVPPAAASHLFYQHCNASDPNKRDWLIHDAYGPAQWEESGYVWIAPGVPDYQAYMRKQIMYVVNTYDVDGVHFDRIRTPGDEYSYDPISMARMAGDGNPENRDFHDWTRDQITRMLCDLYAEIMEVKPHIKVSAAPFGLYKPDRYPGYSSGFTYGYLDWHQESQRWLEVGAMDLLVPMIYWASNGINPEYREVLPDWIAHNAGRHVVGGQAAYKAEMDLAEMVDQVTFTRQEGGQGTVAFSYSSFGYWYDYSNPGGVYEEPAARPAMSWKDNPTKGIILGTVTAEDGVTPVVDAHVTWGALPGAYTALSSADGLYSFLELVPGTYTLTFDKPGVGTRQISGVAVSAGVVTRLDVSLGDDVLVTILADPTSIRHGQSVHFTPSVNLPPGETIISHTWHFGDEDAPAAGAPEPVEHVYPAPDTYAAWLEVQTGGSGVVNSNVIQISVGYYPGDFDEDSDVDQEDFGHIQGCLTETTTAMPAPGCENTDFDQDNDVDQNDVTTFLRCLSGPDIAPAPDCAD